MSRVLRPGDQVLFNDAEWTVAAVGEAVRLVDSAGASQVVLLSYLLSSPGFEFLTGAAATPVPRLEPTGLLDVLPEEIVAAAQEWERHVVEVLTGLWARGRGTTTAVRP